jgi:hypothetical protein
MKVAMNVSYRLAVRVWSVYGTAPTISPIHENL